MRLIDADAADVERIVCYYGDNCRIEDVQEWLDDQPTIDAAPVRRGEWKVTDAWPHKVYCSNCFATFAKSTVMGDVDAKSVPRPHFCPNCGADMRGDKDETR